MWGSFLFVIRDGISFQICETFQLPRFIIIHKSTKLMSGAMSIVVL